MREPLYPVHDGANRSAARLSTQRSHMNNQSHIPDPDRHWGFMLGAGIFVMLLGAVAISRPVASSVEIEFLLGLILVAVGSADLILAVMTRRNDGFWRRLLLSVVAVATGVLLLRAPLVGLLSMTLILAAYLTIQGTLRVIDAVQSRGQEHWVIRLVGGLASALLGVLVFHGWPVDAAWAIGLLVGVHLMIGGAVTVAIAVAAANVEDAVRDRVDAIASAMAA